MIHSTLLPALLAMGAGEPLASTTYPAIEPSTLLIPQDTDEEDIFSYSYIEIGATSYDAESLGDEEFDDEADAFNAELSLEIFRIFNVFLGYETLDFDNLDVDFWTLGAGVHFSVLPKLDLTGDIAWISTALDGGDNFDEDTSDIQARIGARWMLLLRESWGLEAFGRVTSLTRDDDIYDDDNFVGFDLGARLHFAKRFSVAGEYSAIEDDDQVGFSARFSF
jgi:hypothetical protein